MGFFFDFTSAHIAISGSKWRYRAIRKRTYFNAGGVGGSTEEQTFQIWIGSASDGKSTLIDMFEKTFSEEYTGNFPVRNLTKKTKGWKQTRQ